jgi:hypothetical protein
MSRITRARETAADHYLHVCVLETQEPQRHLRGIRCIQYVLLFLIHLFVAIAHSLSAAFSFAANGGLVVACTTARRLQRQCSQQP